MAIRYSLRCNMTESSTLGECVSGYEFAQTAANLLSFSAGRTDCHTSAIQAAHPSPRLFRRKSQVSAAPLHRLLRAAQVRPGSHFALARNDMLKFARCPRSTGVLPGGDLVRVGWA